MSQRDPEVNYERLDQALEFCFWQEAKRLHTAVPGVVERYDSETKRADIQVALNLLVGTVGSDERPVSMPRQVVLDVPVVHPSGGGYVVHVPLVKGDAVMLLFSERGLDAFKETFEVADPTRGSFFMERDAVALPGFGALEITPVEPGITVQSEDGRQFMRVDKEGHIQVRATDTIRIGVGSSQIYVDSGNIWLNAGHVHLNDSGAP